jgi:hypothetical protein
MPPPLLTTDPYFTLKVVIGLFSASLVGAFVLFGVLKSFAWITEKRYQAGGAIAGFLLIFGVLSTMWWNATWKLAENQRMTADAQLKIEEAKTQQVVEWSVDGEVRLEGVPVPNQISVSQAPTATVDRGGHFALVGVRTLRKRYPRLYIQGDDAHIPATLEITEAIAKIDPGSSEITLRGPIELRKIPPAEFVDVSAPLAGKGGGLGK